MGRIFRRMSLAACTGRLNMFTVARALCRSNGLRPELEKPRSLGTPCIRDSAEARWASLLCARYTWRVTGNNQGTLFRCRPCGICRDCTSRISHKLSRRFVWDCRCGLTEGGRYLGVMIDLAHHSLGYGSGSGSRPGTPGQRVTEP